MFVYRNLFTTRGGGLGGGSGSSSTSSSLSDSSTGGGGGVLTVFFSFGLSTCFSAGFSTGLDSLTSTCFCGVSVGKSTPSSNFLNKLAFFKRL